MCVQVRRDYEVSHLDADRAGRFAAAALLNVLPPTAWQVAADAELVVGQYVQRLSERIDAGTAFVEVSAHASHVELVVGADDARWIDERVRLRPRREFAPTFECRLADPRPPALPRPVLWPALAQPRVEPSPDDWSQMWDALHSITQSIRDGDGRLTTTLDAIAAGVVRATTFTVAAVNLVQQDGAFRVVAVEGSAEARAALLNVVEPNDRWMELIDGGIGWGSLRYIPDDLMLSSATTMATWSDSHVAPSDPDLWNPLDALIAPLYSAEHVCLGALSVDMAAGAPRPATADLERLEVFADHAAAAIERAQGDYAAS